MKKSYTKPELFFEEYQLSEAIAGGCGDTLNSNLLTSSSLNSCGYKLGGRSVLFVTSGVCNSIPSSDVDSYEQYGYCYQTSSGHVLVFNS